VIVRGSIGEATGMVINLVELKHLIWTLALDNLDHKNLDLDVPYFKNKPRYFSWENWKIIHELGWNSTAENVAAYIWNLLEPAIRRGETRLFEIKLQETPNNTVYYRGD
jgi:6-pyruvoyltetrahydropterin/6-carboxytetrahydropterin synthase